MKRILVVGTGPLFGPDVTFFSGQAHRTWHFARVLHDAGIDLDLVVLQVEGDARKDPSQPSLIRAEREGLLYHTVNAANPEEIKQILASRLSESNPDAIVGVNVNASYLACQLPTWLPIWADLYGHLMGEAQAKCLREGDDRLLAHFWQRQRIILRRADRFSTVSLRQKYATLGELGCVGRLNRLTAGYRFIDVIPSAASEEYLNLPTDQHSNESRGKVFPRDAFAVLWSGGFNTWTDPMGLAAALSLAMEQVPGMHLVVTGGEIRGHDEKTFSEFKDKMTQAGLADRCHFLGWIEGSRLLALYRDVDLGLNFDALIYESVFGARTRLTNMMAAGLPVLTTISTEISEIVERHQLGFAVPAGDVNAYSDCLVRAAKNSIECKRRGRRAREFVRKYFSYEETARPLLEWVESPQTAPDNSEKKRLFPHHASPRTIPLNPVEEEAMWLEMHDVHQLALEAHNYRMIQRHPLYRLWKRLKKMVGRD
ncbi:MAG: glycosyltransferase family 4 protein [Candidatus Sumerlaeaceae bacterium]|nr:glycosyltransferase family 4 protein [Candidatus Sumerlaeaceae bacterium]